MRTPGSSYLDLMRGQTPIANPQRGGRRRSPEKRVAGKRQMSARIFWAPSPRRAARAPFGVTRAAALPLEGRLRAQAFRAQVFARGRAAGVAPRGPCRGRYSVGAAPLELRRGRGGKRAAPPVADRGRQLRQGSAGRMQGRGRGQRRCCERGSEGVLVDRSGIFPAYPLRKLFILSIENCGRAKVPPPFSPVDS